VLEGNPLHSHVLDRLADVDTIIHGSVLTLDPQAHRIKILREEERYEKIEGRAVRRVVTATSRV